MKMTGKKQILSLRILFVVTDVGFIVYWAITLLGVIPPQHLFKDYDNPILSAWNWSFLPLDLLVSASGLYSLRLMAKANPAWRNWALVSLVLTFCSGLQALAFWTLRADFDLTWWLPNAYLMLYPLVLLKSVLRER